MNQDRPRFQFSITNLLIATVLVALAAWVATLRFPVKIMPVKIVDLQTGAVQFVELPIIAAVLGLVGAAIGVIVQGQPTLGRSAYQGCVFAIFLPCICLALISFFYTARELARWLMRLL
jgi:hypothetical protein